MSLFPLLFNTWVKNPRPSKKSKLGVNVSLTLKKQTRFQGQRIHFQLRLSIHGKEIKIDQTQRNSSRHATYLRKTRATRNHISCVASKCRFMHIKGKRRRLVHIDYSFSWRGMLLTDWVILQGLRNANETVWCRETHSWRKLSLYTTRRRKIKEKADLEMRITQSS